RRERRGAISQAASTEHLVDSGDRADDTIHGDEVARCAGVVHSVAGTDGRLSFAEPRNIPCNTDRRRKVVIVVTPEVGSDFRMGRILSDELYSHEIAACAGESDRTRASRALYVRQGRLITDDTCRQPVVFVWLAVPFPMHAEIHCEVAVELPVVFEI